MAANSTLLALVDALARHGRSEAEIIAIVVYMVNSGHVRLCGIFSGARFDGKHCPPSPDRIPLNLLRRP